MQLILAFVLVDGLRTWDEACVLPVAMLGPVAWRCYQAAAKLEWHQYGGSRASRFTADIVEGVGMMRMANTVGRG